MLPRVRRFPRRRFGGFRRKRVVRPNFRRRRVTRRRVVRRHVSRRRILSVSTVKKWDDMPPAVVQGIPAVTPIVVTGPQRSVFICSARRQYSGTVGLDHNRASSRTFCRGYKETALLDISGSTEWGWRRIVFAFKGDIYTGSGTATDQPFYDDPTSGMTRSVQASLSIGALAAVQQSIYEGTQGVDWQDERVAKPDRDRITLLSDKTRMLKGTTDDDHAHRFNLWYPINKDLFYNDIQSGKQTNIDYVSTQADNTIGDIYIYDFWWPANFGLTETLSMRITLQGRYYWHER